MFKELSTSILDVLKSRLVEPTLTTMAFHVPATLDIPYQMEPAQLSLLVFLIAQIMRSSTVSHALATLDTHSIQPMDALNAKQVQYGMELNVPAKPSQMNAQTDMNSAVPLTHVCQELPHAVNIHYGMELYVFVLQMLI